MKLISSPPVARTSMPWADVAFTAGLLGWLAALELVGRYAVTDFQDAIAAAALSLAVAAVVARHRRQPLPWVSRGLVAAGRAARRLGRFKYDHGIDLRGTPPLPRKLPRAVWPVAAGLVGWAGLAGLGWAAYPDGWREPAARTFYLGYLVAVSFVWLGLFACVMAGLYLPVRLLDDLLRRWFPREGDRRVAEMMLLASYLMTTMTVASLIPTAVVLGLCLVVAAAAGVAMARRGGDGPAVLWRTGTRRQVYAVPLHRLVAGVALLLAGLVFDLLLTGCGGRLFGGKELPEGMPLTTLLGWAAAWLLPGVVGLLAVKAVAALRTDPGRRDPPTVHVSGAEPAAVAAATATVTGWGWRVRTGPPETTDVGIEVVPAERSQADEFEPRWPLPVGTADLVAGKVKDRLARRDEIQLRRRVARGLTALFKRPAGGRQRRGGGYWFAPHWWFVDSLGREDGSARDADALRSVGPSFAEAFGPRARQHLHRVFRAVQVDMVFIEDGVGHRAIERVLRALYELYDVHGGKRKAEDHHFRGVPKVRVMIHEYTPSGPRFRVGRGYREPEYSDLSRARVLHVFRDRGGLEEEVDVPFDSSWEPAPALGMG